MKALLTIVLILGFAGVAVFGVFSMQTDTHDMQTHSGGCIAATAQGVGCPNQSSLGDYLAFHLDAFRNLSTATFSAAAALLALALFAVGIAVGISSGSAASPGFSYHRFRRSDLAAAFSKYEFTRWLALHETSPTNS